MTGEWESKLRNLAEGGQPWDVPARQDLIQRLETLHTVLDSVASDPGVYGVSGDAASNRFAAAATGVADQVDYLRLDLVSGLRDANAQRADAAERLAKLGNGELTPGQAAVVRGAAMGTTLMFGPFSVLAGEGAVQAFNAFLGDQREQQAEQEYLAVQSQLDQVSIPKPPPLAFDPTSEEDPEPVPPTPRPGGGDFGGGPTVGIARAPQFHLEQVPDPERPERPERPDFEIPDGDPRDPDYPGPVIDLEEIPDDYVPTPDGPTGGIGTLPGTYPGGPGGTTLPGGGSSGGLGGTGVGLGLAAGAGGAAALGRLGGGSALGGLGRGGVPAAGGGALGVRGGAAGIGGTAGGGAAGAAGGARGGAAGAGMRGAGGMGGGGMGGGAGATGANARGAGGRGAGMMGGGGAPGGRGDRRTQQGQGLGGPIAERMEDDEDFGPRSESAGAGGRD